MNDADRYFAMDHQAEEVATGGAYFEVDKDVSAVELVPGLVFRPVVGEQLMASFVRFGPNTAAPIHTHEEEQITVVLEGELEFDLAGDLRTMRPGMAVAVPPGIPHGARTRDIPCSEIDIFHPPRRVLLELTKAAGEQSAETTAPSTPCRPSRRRVDGARAVDGRYPTPRCSPPASTGRPTGRSPRHWRSSRLPRTFS